MTVFNPTCFEDSEFEDILERTFQEVSFLRSQDKELFFETHTPMILVWENPKGKSDIIEIKEEEIVEQVLKRLTQTNKRKYIVLIKGDTGTGKSELCAYLNFKLLHDSINSFYILPILKDQSWLEITDTLAQKYKDFFSDELPESASLKKLKQEVKEHPNKLKDICISLAQKIITYLRFDRGIISALSDDDKPTENLKIIGPISEFLYSKLIRLFKKDTEKSQDMASKFDIFNVKKVEEFKKSGYLPQKMEITLSDLTNEMNNGLIKAMKKEYNIRNINEIFKSFHQKLQESGQKKKIIIIIEDFGLTGNDLDQFGRFMVTDQYQMFDFFIAGTDEMIIPLIDQTAKARGKIYSTSIGDDYDTLFLRKDNVDEFVARYIKYLKKKLSFCQACNNKFDCINRNYPFTKFYLERLFINLEGKELQPRDFLAIISLLLEEFRSKKYPFDIAVDRFKNKPDYSIREELLKENPNEYINLLKWYGKPDVDNIMIDEEICEFFTISLDKSPNVILKPYNDIMNLSLFDLIDDTTLVGGQTVVIGGPTIVDLSEDQRKLVETFKEKIANYDRWYSDPTNTETDVDNFNQLIKIGLKHILLELETQSIYNILILYKDDLFDDIYFRRLKLVQEIDDYSNLSYFEGVEISNYDKVFFEGLLQIGIIILENLDLDNTKTTITSNIIEDYYRELNDLKKNLQHVIFNRITFNLKGYIFKGGTGVPLYRHRSINMKLIIDGFCKVLFFFLNLHIFLTDPFKDLNDPKTIRNFIYKTQEFQNDSNFSLKVPKNLKSLENVNKYHNVTVDFFKRLLSIDEFYESFNEAFINLVNSKYTSPYQLISSHLNQLISKKLYVLGILNSLTFSKKYTGRKLSDFLNNYITLKRNLDTYNKNKTFEKDYEAFQTNYLDFLNKLSTLDKEKVVNAINNSSFLKDHPLIKKDIQLFTEQLEYNFFINLKSTLLNIDNIFKVAPLKSLMLEQLEQLLENNKLLKAYKNLDSKLTSTASQLDIEPLKKLMEIL